MLEFLHNASKTWIARILFALLIVSFGAWGVGSSLTSITTDTTAAEVGSEKIEIEELSRDFDREVKRLRPLLGNKLTNEQARQMGLLDSALSQLITRSLFKQEAERLGLSVGTEELRQTILGISAFQGENGKFDKNLYLQTLSNNNLNEASFFKLLKGDVVRSQLLNAVTGTIAVPPSLTNLVYAYRFERRVADFLVAAASAMPAPAAPSEKDMADFHQANAAKFTAPESRQFQVLHLTQESLIAENKPTDAEIEEAYRVRIDEFSTPERRIVLQMLFDSEDKAKAAAQKLDSGEAFAKVAKSDAGMDDRAILLGRIEKRDLPADLAVSVFALPKDGVTPPLKTPLGWHILKVTEINTTAPKPLAEVKAQIARELSQDNASKAMNTLVAQIEDDVAGGARLEEAAKKFNLKMLGFGPVDARGNDEAGKPVKKLPVPDKLLELAYSTPEGADSQIVELDDGLIAVKVEKVTPSALKPLKDVYAEVKAQWIDAQKHKTAQERAQKALERLKAGTAFSAVAQEFGLQVKSTQPFLRDAPSAEHGLPPKLVNVLFKGKPGDADWAATPDGAIVARLGKIVPSKPEDNPDRQIEIAQSLEQGLSGDLLEQYVVTLTARYGVKKHQATIDKFFRQP